MKIGGVLSSLSSAAAVFGLACVALGGCATGSDDPVFGTGPKGAVGDSDDSGGDTGSTRPGTDDGSNATEYTSDDDGSADGGDGGDGGNPMCCEPHAGRGCGSAATEACVCTHTPECCLEEWTQDCADLAYGCGDPYCQETPVGTGGEGTGGTGEPPPEDTDDAGEGSDGDPEPPPPPPPPPPDCECLGHVDNFCLYGPNYPDCPMTAAGGYCDPNGDGDFEDGDWVTGYFDYQDNCA